MIKRIVFVTMFVFVFISLSFAKCDDLYYSINDAIAEAHEALNYAESSYSYARKAFLSDNLDDLQYYARKVMSAAEYSLDVSNNAENYAYDAEIASNDCDCDELIYFYVIDAVYAASDAISYAGDIHRYAKKAYYSENIYAGQYYARKSKNAASDSISAIESLISSAETALYECY